MVLNPYPSPRQLELARGHTAERFIRDIERQDWHWTGGTFVLEGPVANIDPGLTPRRREQTGDPGRYVQNRPSLLEADSWLYFIAGTFWRDLPATEILVPSNSHTDQRYLAQYPKGVLSSLHS